MNCTEARELLSAYFDGELSDEVRANVAEHLAHCDECSNELATFQKLSDMAEGLSEPQPPAGMWQQLEEKLDSGQQLKPVPQSARPSSIHPRIVTVAALILVAVGLVFGYLTWFGHSHDELAVDFEHYLEEFLKNPDEAQNVLLEKYKNVAVDVEDAINHVGYQPVVAKGLPEGYSLELVYVLDMPCCKCVHCVCKHNDQRVIAIFEHDEEQSIWFGDRPKKSVECGGKPCSIVEVDDQLAASWNIGKRHITIVGAKDTDEVSRLVAFLGPGDVQ